jgi:hypothetical protein
MAPHDRSSPSHHDQILLPPSQQHEHRGRGRTFARRCDDLRLVCRRKEEHVLETTTTTTQEQAAAPIIIASSKAVVVVIPQQQENILLRASRRVLSAASRRRRRRRLRWHTTTVAMNDVIPPQPPHRRCTLPPSRKHSSLQHDHDSPPPQDAAEDEPVIVVLHETWYYSSNHVLVNRERMMRGIRPLMRSIALDEMARTIATISANKNCCQPQEPQEEPDTSTMIPKYYHGHILVGESIRSIHQHTLRHDPKARDKILDVDYREFGMATCKGQDGRLHLCQLFDRTRVEI